MHKSGLVSETESEREWDERISAKLSEMREGSSFASVLDDTIALLLSVMSGHSSSIIDEAKKFVKLSVGLVMRLQLSGCDVDVILIITVSKENCEAESAEKHDTDA